MELARKISVCVMVVLFSGLMVLPASAEVTLDDLLKRIEALEAENTALKGEVMALKDKQVAQEVKITTVEQKTTAVAAAPAGNFLKTKMDMELYGFVMAQGSYSDSDMASSNSPTAAPRETGLNKNQDEFNLTGQDTRLGLNIKGPDLDNGGKTSGKFEMDFAANNGPTYQPRLRLAYVQLDFDKWAVNAGQNWDIFAPLNPSVLNPGTLFRQGNAGYRHGQVHLVNKWGNILGGKVTTKIGIIDSDDSQQENSGVPVLAAQSAYETSVLGKTTTFYLSGLWGENEIENSVDGTIWGVSVGSSVKLADWLAFKAEGFSGAKLDDFTGGSSVGFTTNGSGSKPVRVHGGFMELTYNPLKKTEMNFGIGIDSANDDAYIPAGDRDDIYDVNKTYYTNLKYNLSKELQLGLEYQYFETRWVDGVEGDANRVMSAIIYKF